MKPALKRSTAVFLQVAVTLVGLATLLFLLWEPHVEGRNAHATWSEIYFHDPFLAFVYAGSVPFFFALSRSFGLLGAVRRTGSFTMTTVEALHTIKRCGLVMLGFVFVGIGIVLRFGDPDDRPAGLFMGLLVAAVAGAIAVVANVCARKVQAALASVGSARSP